MKFRAIYEMPVAIMGSWALLAAMVAAKLLGVDRDAWTAACETAWDYGDKLRKEDAAVDEYLRRQGE